MIASLGQWFHAIRGHWFHVRTSMYDPSRKIITCSCKKVWIQ